MIWTWMVSHQILLMSIGWPVLSGLLNTLLHWKTAEAWEAWVEKNPVGAVLVKALRAAGLNPPGLLRSLQTYLAARAAKSGQRDASVPPAPPT